MTSGQAQPVSAQIAAAQQAAPAGSRAMTITLPNASGDAAVIRFTAPQRSSAVEDTAASGAASGGGTRGEAGSTNPAAAARSGGSQVFLDPVTLAILEVRKSGEGVLFLIHRLHGNLLISGAAGRSIVGWLGVVMLVLGVSGIFMWWPRNGRWREAFTVKWSARPLRLNRDLHGATGIWGLAVFMVVSFSGVYLAFPQSLNATIGAVLPVRDFRQADAALKAVPVEGQRPLDVDGAIALALADRPDNMVQSISLPMRPDQPYRVTLTAPHHVAGAPAVSVYVDPWAQRVLATRDPATFSVGESLMAWQRPLHGGAGLGWFWRLLVFASGLLPLLFAVTGTTFWLLKRRSRRNTHRRMPISAKCE
jgi:uncharacterized iron-regulated membrane protein